MHPERLLLTATFIWILGGCATTGDIETSSAPVVSIPTTTEATDTTPTPVSPGAYIIPGTALPPGSAIQPPKPLPPVMPHALGEMETREMDLP